MEGSDLCQFSSAMGVVTFVAYHVDFLMGSWNWKLNFFRRQLTFCAFGWIDFDVVGESLIVRTAL